MHKLIKQLQSTPQIYCEDSANISILKSCQNYLYDTYQIKLPKEYSLLLQYANGIHSPLATIFGVMPSNLSDIICANEDNRLFNKNNYIILGYNNFDWLVYNQEKDCYQTYDKHDLMLIDTFAELKSVIIQWFT